MENDRKAFPVVYEMTVIQTYKGNMETLIWCKKVYAVREKGEWKVVWIINSRRACCFFIFIRNEHTSAVNRPFFNRKKTLVFFASG